MILSIEFGYGHKRDDRADRRSSLEQPFQQIGLVFVKKQYHATVELSWAFTFAALPSVSE